MHTESTAPNAVLVPERVSIAQGVSVVVPCYNAEAHLSVTIESLLAQSKVPDEIIILDDGSVDRSAEVARSYGKVVRVFQQANAGAAAARYKGVRMAKFSVVVFIDAGDIAAPEKVESYYLALEENPRAVCAFGVSWNTAEQRPERSPFTSGPLDGAYTVVEDPFDFMIRHFWPITGVMDIAVRRDVALRSMDIPPFYRVANDYAAQISTALCGPFVHVARVTSEFKFLPDGLTKSHGLPLQIVYALCGAVDAYESVPPDAHRKTLLVARVDNDAYRSLLVAYMRKNWPLVARLLKILFRYGTVRRAPRYSWWALKNAYTQQQLNGSPLLRATVGRLVKLSRHR